MILCTKPINQTRIMRTTILNKTTIDQLINHLNRKAKNYRLRRNRSIPFFKKIKMKRMICSCSQWQRRFSIKISLELNRDSLKMVNSMLISKCIKKCDCKPCLKSSKRESRIYNQAGMLQILSRKMML